MGNAIYRYSDIRPKSTLGNKSGYNNGGTESFGQSVDVDGSYCVVGSPYTSYGQNYACGIAYIFDAITGQDVRTIQHPYPTGYETFGEDVAISGDYCAIGCPGKTVSGIDDAGCVYIFSVSTGALVRTIDNPYPIATYANFGVRVDIDGDYCLVSDTYRPLNGYNYSGCVYLFSISTGSLLRTYLNPNVYGSAEADVFGFSIGISGENIIVSSFDRESPTENIYGLAVLYTIYSDTPTHFLYSPYGAGYFFGDAVAIDSDRCAVSCISADTSDPTKTGSVRIYDVSSGTLVTTIDSPRTDVTWPEFGYSVSISNNYCVIGSPSDIWDDDNSGIAYLYELDSGKLLNVIQNPNPDSLTTDDYFGCAVAINGQNIIIGSMYEDDSYSEYSGKSYLYSLGGKERVRNLRHKSTAFERTQSIKTKQGTWVRTNV